MQKSKNNNFDQKMDLTKFKSKVQLQVRYADLDTYGHVNNKVFLSFLEEARIAYVKDLKLDDKMTIFDFGSVVGRIDIKYLHPVHFGDNVFAYTRCNKIGNKSYELENIITTEKNGQKIICAHANVTMVAFDLKTNKTKELDKKMIDLIMNFEIEKPLLKSKK